MNSTQPRLSREQQLESRMAGLRVRFIARAGEDRALISEAWRAGNLHTIGELAHRLAGVAATFGFPRIGVVARDLDRAIGDGHRPHIDAELERLVLLLDHAENAVTPEEPHRR